MCTPRHTPLLPRRLGACDRPVCLGGSIVAIDGEKLEGRPLQTLISKADTHVIEVERNNKVGRAAIERARSGSLDGGPADSPGAKAKRPGVPTLFGGRKSSEQDAASAAMLARLATGAAASEPVEAVAGAAAGETKQEAGGAEAREAALEARLSELEHAMAQRKAMEEGEEEEEEEEETEDDEDDPRDHPMRRTSAQLRAEWLSGLSCSAEACAIL